MRAVIQDRYGPPADVLHIGEIARPIPADDEVLVRVKAASVHADVWHVVTGRPYVLRLMGAGVKRPNNPVPGTDLSGIVESVGKSVTGPIFGGVPRSVGLMVMSPFVRGLPKADLTPPSKREVMDALADLLESGALTPIIDRTFPLEAAAEALGHLQEGRARGKILIAPSA